MFSVSVQFAKK